MKAKVMTLPLAELVEDMELYPRHSVDNANVAQLVMALEAGAQLPPIIIDAKSKAIVDGWHRARAYRRHLGPESVVDVEAFSYPNKGAMIVDAVARNAAHGRRLDVIDQTRAILMMEREGVNEKKIALALNVPQERITKLRVRIATSNGQSISTVPGTRTITLKRPVKHFHGRQMTAAQAKVHDMLPGTSFLLVARQLTFALREKMVDLTDEKLVVQLRELHGELDAALVFEMT